MVITSSSFQKKVMGHHPSRFSSEPGSFSTPWSLGMGKIQPLVGNPYFMGPYKPLRTWVDEFIPYGNVMGVDRPDRRTVVKAQKKARKPMLAAHPAGQ